MRVVQLNPQRPAYYDRNPVNKVLRWSSPYYAPHPVTTRASYIVPAGRKAEVNVMFVEVTRAEVPTVAGTARAGVELIPLGGLADFLAKVEVDDSILYNPHIITFTNGGVILPGDELLVWTEDTSTGGAMRYRLYVKLMEFDA